MSTWDDKPSDYEHALAEIARLRAETEHWKSMAASHDKTIDDHVAEIERLCAVLADARLALDLALLSDGLSGEIKNRLRTAWLKIGDALNQQEPPDDGKYVRPPYDNKLMIR